MIPVSNGRTCPTLSIALCGLLWLSSSGNSYAGPPADPVLARGEQIARQVCSLCHVTSDHQEFPPILRTPTPSFSEIANRPGTTAKSLQRFITTTHWDENAIPMSMPDPMLMSDQAVAVSRYIMSQRKR